MQALPLEMQQEIHSNDHEHPQRMKYTIHLAERHWWGGRKMLALTGIGSSLKDGELLIFHEHGAFTSINYMGVRWMEAEPWEGWKAWD